MRLKSAHLAPLLTILGLTACEDGRSGAYLDLRAGMQLTSGAEDTKPSYNLGIAGGVYFDTSPERVVRADWGVGYLHARVPSRVGTLGVSALGLDFSAALRPWGPWGSEFILNYTGIAGSVSLMPPGSDSSATIDGSWAHAAYLGYSINTLAPGDDIGLRFGAGVQGMLARTGQPGFDSLVLAGPQLRLTIVFPFTTDINSPEAQEWVRQQNEDTHRQFEEQRQREQERDRRYNESQQRSINEQICIGQGRSYDQCHHD